MKQAITLTPRISVSGIRDENGGLTKRKMNQPMNTRANAMDVTRAPCIRFNAMTVHKNV